MGAMPLAGVKEQTIIVQKKVSIMNSGLFKKNGLWFLLRLIILKTRKVKSVVIMFI